MRAALVLALLLAPPALADWWNVTPSGGPVPVSDPKCVANCDDAAPSSSSSSSNTRYVDPQEEARKAAAAEEARRQAEQRAREALREFEESRDAVQRLGTVGAEVRQQARRFSDYREQLEQRETKVRSLERALAPVSVEKPAAGARTSLSMKEYCDRLNAAAAPARGLRASEVPLPGTAVRTAAFAAPPTFSPGRFTEVTGAIQRARAALKEEVTETAKAIGWRFLDQHVPFLKSARELFENGKQNYEALSGLNTRLATNAMTQAEGVALTVGGAGGTVTSEDNDRLLRSMGRDVSDTSGKLLADQARGALRDSMLDRADEWFLPGEEP